MNDISVFTVEQCAASVNAGRSGGVGNANSRSLSTGDAYLSPRCHLHVHVDAIHTGVLDRVSDADHRRTGTQDCSAAAEMGDRLATIIVITVATIDMGRKLGRAVPPFLEGRGGAVGPHLTQCALGRGIPWYQVVS